MPMGLYFEDRTGYTPKKNVKGENGKKYEQLVFLSTFSIEFLEEMV